jgi:tRNA pseudouridine38/39 synthase
MLEAAQKLVGEHDYRNFCKMDVGNGVVTFVRRIEKVSLNILDKEPNL